MNFARRTSTVSLKLKLRNDFGRERRYKVIINLTRRERDRRRFEIKLPDRNARNTKYVRRNNLRGS